VAGTLSSLGWTLQNLGDPQEAKKNFERALMIEEKVYGPDHPEVAETLNNLGMTLQNLGDLQEAKRNFERALMIEEKVYGPDILRWPQHSVTSAGPCKT